MTNLSDTALQKEVFEYAQQLSGGRAFMPVPNKTGVWYIKLDDGTNINVRTVSSSQAGRWTVDIQGKSPLLELSGLSKMEVKFK